jgi:hypothetical protein
MPGTRTAPAITGAASFIEVSLRWIDAVGDVRSDASLIDAAATDIQIEAVAADMQTGSNASLYAVRKTEVYEGAKAKSNALAAVRESVQSNIVYHSKDTGRDDRRAFIPAPLAALFLAGTEVPDEGDAVIVAIMLAWENAWAGTFAGVSLRFTERREINEKVNL